ncbi:plasmid pRiA4b ORF-3 family protein [Stygiolobus caldivivus]|nr:plasmid pRiA4b ORF-3 family protein [Stygiolobus caldivivus]
MREGYYHYLSPESALRHFRSCDKVKEVLSGELDGFILHIKDNYFPQYWLYIAVPSSLTLEDLDKFLRDIWVECCGHLSEFEIGGESVSPDGEADEITDNSFGDDEGVITAKDKLSDILHKGLEFGYTYDFGISTELTLRVVDGAK